MNDLLEIVDAAAQSQDWVILAIAAVLIIVPIVLKALGKKVPLVDAALSLAVGVLKSVKRKQPPPPEVEGGVGAVVPVAELPKPPEAHSDTLK